MTAFDIRALRDLAKQLTDRRELIAAELVGGGATDWADYQRRVGEAKGIDHALNAADAIEHKMTAGDRPQGNDGGGTS
jgi:hypothetical protein